MKPSNSVQFGLRPLLFSLLLLTLASCLRTHETRGNFVEDARWQTIKPGMSQVEVAKILGTPTTQGLFRDDLWIYIGSKESHVAFLSPRIDQSRFGYVSFDGEGHVKTAEMAEPQRWNDVSISSDKTPDLSHRKTVMGSIFGNIGRFNRSSEGIKPRVGGARGM